MLKIVYSSFAVLNLYRSQMLH